MSELTHPESFLPKYKDAVAELSISFVTCDESIQGGVRLADGHSPDIAPFLCKASPSILTRLSYIVPAFSALLIR